MALQNILAQVGADGGIKLNSTPELQYTVALINSVAKELYNENDLRGCEREQLIELDSDAQQIALPTYVDKLISARDYQSKMPITQNDMRPRYMWQNWRRPFLGFPNYTWRMKNVMPIMRNITNAGPLKISLPFAPSALFTTAITGSTVKSSRLQEVVSFYPEDPVDSNGCVTKETTNSFTDIISINKSDETEMDISIYDIDDNLLAALRNCDKTTRYQIVQVMDRGEQQSNTQLCEILFKLKFIPFQNDFDEFPCGDFYDEVIYWKTLAKYYSKQKDGKDYALTANAKAEDTLAKIVATAEGAIKKTLQFGKNPVFESFTEFGQGITTSPRWNRFGWYGGQAYRYF